MALQPDPEAGNAQQWGRCAGRHQPLARRERDAPPGGRGSRLAGHGPDHKQRHAGALLPQLEAAARREAVKLFAQAHHDDRTAQSRAVRRLLGRPQQRFLGGRRKQQHPARIQAKRIEAGAIERSALLAGSGERPEEQWPLRASVLGGGTQREAWAAAKSAGVSPTISCRPVMNSAGSIHTRGVGVLQRLRTACRLHATNTLTQFLQDGLLISKGGHGFCSHFVLKCKPCRRESILSKSTGRAAIS